jgi:pimeloyl-ACP methyl ester carboxylesterase
VSTVFDRIDDRSRSLRLRDGRRLAFAEYGDPNGIPLFAFHGLPGSRLQVEAFWREEPTEFRVIAPDRPGAGRADFQPGRRLVDWPGDVEQLADALGIDRFLVAGVSGGADHALACAHALPERVIAAASISGTAAMDTQGALEAMHKRNRQVVKLAVDHPLVLRTTLAPLAFLSKRAPKLALRATSSRGIPDSDRKVFEDPHVRDVFLRTSAESFRQGVRATVQETQIHATSWGFDPADINTKVLMFHGELDANAPVAMCHALAEVIPDRELTLYPGEGHLIIPRHWPDIASALLTAHAKATA